MLTPFLVGLHTCHLFFLGDEAFALHQNIMNPYAGLHRKESSERTCNYCLNRARRVVENALGISSAVFRVLRKRLLVNLDKVALIVSAITYLHNFLRSSSSNRIYCPPGELDRLHGDSLVEGCWRRDVTEASMQNLHSIQDRRATAPAEGTRKEFMQEGRLSERR